MKRGTGAVKSVLLRVAIVALCITALIAIVAVMTARFDETEAKFLMTHVAVAAYSLFALGIAAVADRRPRTAIAGWTACGAGLVLALVSIWAGLDGAENDNLYRWTWILFVVAFTSAHASLIDSRRRESDGSAVQTISTLTIATVVLMGVLVAGGVARAESVGTPYLRLLGVIGVLDVLGTLVLPIARKVEQSSASASDG
jgi:hypothetical protein